jgi:hypothetical protein
VGLKGEDQCEILFFGPLSLNQVGLAGKSYPLCGILKVAFLMSLSLENALFVENAPHHEQRWPKREVARNALSDRLPISITPIFHRQAAVRQFSSWLACWAAGPGRRAPA